MFVSIGKYIDGGNGQSSTCVVLVVAIGNFDRITAPCMHMLASRPT
jgi:hypothetical protein